MKIKEKLVMCVDGGGVCIGRKDRKINRAGALVLIVCTSKTYWEEKYRVPTLFIMVDKLLEILILVCENLDFYVSMQYGM